MDETVELAVQALEQGVTHMVCTPHINPGVFDNHQDNIEAVFQEVVEELRANDIALALSYSCEVRLCTEITQWVSQSSLPLLGSWKEKPVLLLELPHSHVPAGTDSLIHWLQKKGIQPVIPHPERNRDILANYDKATWLKSMGVMFQATAGAFTGTFGDAVEETVFRMLDENLIGYVASDMHNLKRRPNEMANAYKAVLAVKGALVANRLFVDTPKAITSQTVWC